MSIDTEKSIDENFDLPSVGETIKLELDQDKEIGTAENTYIQDLSLEVTLLPFYAELICSESIYEKLFGLRISALKNLQGLLNQYERRGYDAKLLCSIGKKKGTMIMTASSKTELDKILHPKAPHYDGVRFVSDQYLLPEEELICWSEASLRAPLNETGFQRYSELFRLVFPEESERLNIV
jgi:hypothetical protein